MITTGINESLLPSQSSLNEPVKMNFFLIHSLWIGLLVVLGVSSTPFSNEIVALSDWEEYKTTFDKIYATPQEELTRKELFNTRVAEIGEHNRKFVAGQVTWEKGVNMFTDWTEEEFNQFSPSYLQENEQLFREDSKPVEFTSDPNVNVLPEFDWREKRAVTEVKYQICGNCYIYASIVSLEAQYFLRTGVLQDLSVQNIMDCGIDSPSCGGGYVNNVFLYVERKGIMLRKDYPDENGEGECRFDPKLSVMKLKGRGLVNNETLMLEALQTKGPLGVDLYASKDFYSYKSGILSPDPDCAKNYPNHAVNIVGYGTSNGTDFYLIKNSWGKSWGDKGYLRVPRNVNFCGITREPMYPILED